MWTGKNSIVTFPPSARDFQFQVFPLFNRYAFSVLWEVTPEGDIVDVDFKKTIIHSIAALTYQQAQSLIDQPEDDGDIQAGAVKRLASLARTFRAKTNRGRSPHLGQS